MADLVEVDSLEILAIIDNELDPITPSPNAAIQQSGGLRDVAGRNKNSPDDVRGGDNFEMSMSNICCSAHGLSLMITAVIGDQRRTILFDTGPEESAWERNATRLRADIGKIEAIQLSHWHRDHSGGMLKALQMIRDARKEHGTPVVVDLHPNRPEYRGFRAPESPVASFEADPSFDEIKGVGGVVQTSAQPHTVLDGTFLISGEIPRVTAYEKGLRFGVRFTNGAWESDEDMKDERLLMCKVKDKGLVVFTGCAHAGVVNSARCAVELGQGTPLYAVVGGYHLADAPPETIEVTTDDLKALNPKVLMPGHCTGWRAKFALQSKMPGQMVPSFVGNKYVL